MNKKTPVHTYTYMHTYKTIYNDANKLIQKISIWVQNFINHSDSKHQDIYEDFKIKNVRQKHTNISTLKTWY